MTTALSTAQVQALFHPTGPQAIAGRGIDTGIDVPNTGLNIRIVKANGGTIISIRDETRIGPSDLYVISEDQDISVEIGKIITLHYLKS